LLTTVVALLVVAAIPRVRQDPGPHRNLKTGRTMVDESEPGG